jgi:putative hydrolase of the HAD superfamily
MRDGHVVTLVDMGGVFFSYSFDAAIRRWAELARCPAEDLRGRFGIDEPFDHFERGEVSTAEFLRHLRDVLRVDLGPDQLLDGWNSIYGEVNQPLVDRLRRAGDTRLVGVSNTNEAHARVWTTRYAEHLEVFDAVYCSHELGCTKPTRTFFEMVAARCGVPLTALRVLDDQPAVVTEARAMGLTARLYRSVADLDDLLLTGDGR